MRRINREFLDHDYLTDVICFNYRNDLDYDINEIAIEIFISPDIAEERSKEDSSLKYESELLLYLVHAILHASGLNDKTDNEQLIMRQAENRILEKMKGKSLNFSIH